MDTHQQGSQINQNNSPAHQQPGQRDQQAGQSSQDSRFGSQGQTIAGQEQVPAQAKSREQGGRQVSAQGLQAGQPARSQSTATLLPPVDIFEDENGFTLIADMPGVSKDQLVVRVTGDNLLIEGTASVPVISNMELVYGEVQTPQYRRSFTLSRELDPGKIEARLADGVLRLRIPKAEEAKPRRIEVSVG